MMAITREPWVRGVVTRVMSNDWSEASGECTSAPVRHSTISDSLHGVEGKHR